MVSLRQFGQVGFHALGEFAAGEHYPVSAALAFQADVRTQADHGPFVRAAGMRLSQAQMVIQLQVGQHERDYTAAAGNFFRFGDNPFLVESFL